MLVPMSQPPELAVLFVCTGNICRSPTADGVFRKLVADAGLQDRILVDSAGTHDYHVGSPPDPRSVEHAARRGYDLSPLRARRAIAADFERFDLVLAMDRDNRHLLESICPPARRDRLRMFREFGGRPSTKDVPDPYYGGDSGFDQVLDLVEDCARGLLDELRGRLG